MREKELIEMYKRGVLLELIPQKNYQVSALQKKKKKKKKKW